MVPRLLLLLFLLVMRASGALEIGKPFWGFDGHVRQEAFNILSHECPAVTTTVVIGCNLAVSKG